MINIPKRIFLQWHGDGDPKIEGKRLESAEGVTWCADRINDTDIEYVKVSETPVSEQLSDNKNLIKQLEIAVEQLTEDGCKAMAGAVNEAIEELKERRSSEGKNGAGSVINITTEEMQIAEKHPHYFCYTGSNMPEQHEIGCPHKAWGNDDLQRALNTAKAVLRIYQHQLFGFSLE